MDPQIVLTLGILIFAIILFVSERLRVDLIALMVLVALALTGLVTPAEALSGFSNLAVVTVWAVFILSGSLARTGVATVLGRQVLRLAGNSEVRLLVVIMLTVGLLSGFMNDIGVAALFLPVVIDIARRTGQPPSKLLMPLAFAALLGGLNTLIGTPPNILISEALRDYGLRPFSMFDFTPIGLTVMLTGIAFMALIGRHLLPVRDIAKEFPSRERNADLRELYELRERLFVVQLSKDSVLVGKTLAESRLSAALGINVVALIVNGQFQAAPSPDTVLQPGTRLLVSGRPDRLLEMHGRQQLIITEQGLAAAQLVSTEVTIAELGIAHRSELIGRTLEEINFRRQFGVNALAIWRDGEPRWVNLQTTPLQHGDALLVQGSRVRLEALREDSNFLVSGANRAEVYHLHDRLLAVSIPSGSTLVGKTLVESHLGDAFSLNVLGIVRQGSTKLMPSPDEELETGDTLLVEGDPENLDTLRGLQDLEIDYELPGGLAGLETERVGLIEAVLSPRTRFSGKTLRQVHFREKYGVSVLAIWREGRAYRSNLRDMALRFGDALLLYGAREKLRVLGSEPDFLVLTEAAQEPPRKEKAPIAVAIMLAVLLPVILGWLPIAIAAVMGATLMVLTRCVTMEEALQSIEWKAVFLIAGMLPLGIAMERTGAARFLAEGMVSTVGGLGPLAVLAGLFILAALASQVMPNPAVAVLLAPIALNTANDLGISPYPLMMAVAISASAAFLSPVGHSANVLIMGPGGYRFTDYLKVGGALTLAVLVVTMLVLPMIWPLFP